MVELRFDEKKQASAAFLNNKRVSKWFLYVGEFGSEQLAPVIVGKKWAYVDKEYQLRSEWLQFAMNFKNGIAWVKKEGKWCAVDKNLDIVSPLMEMPISSYNVNQIKKFRSENKNITTIKLETISSHFIQKESSKNKEEQQM